MALATALVEIGVDFDEMRKQLNKAKGEFSAKIKTIESRSMASGKNIGQSLGKGIRTGLKAALVGLTAIIGAGGLAVKSFITSQRESLRLAKALKATGNAAGFTAEQLEKQAMKLQDATVIDDTDIKTTQALLASFTNITGKNYEKATKATLDLSIAMKQDLRASAIQLGKALSDPIRGLDSLRKSGVIFTDKQKQLIKTMAETGRIAEAQNEIFEILRVNGIDGNADATAALADQWELFKNIFEDILVDIGEGIASMFGLTDGTTNLTDAMKKLREEVKAFKDKGGFQDIAKVLEPILKNIAKLTVLTGAGLQQLALGFKSLFATGQEAANLNRRMLEVSKSTESLINSIDKLFDPKKPKEQTEEQKKQVEVNKELKDAIDARVAALKESLDFNKKILADSEQELTFLQGRKKLLSQIANIRKIGLEERFDVAQAGAAANVKDTIKSALESQMTSTKAFIKSQKADIKDIEKKLRAEGIEKAAAQQIKNQEIQIELARSTLRAVEGKDSSVFMKE